MSTIDFSKKHSSYSEKQLKGLLRTQQYINLQKKVVFKNRVIEFFRKTAVNGTRYLILFIAGLIPDRFYSSESLLSDSDLEQVRSFYADDWQQILDRADRP